MNLTDRQSIMAGILIGLGACGFLALGGLTGAIIFAFGLIGVVFTGIPLYTGRAGVMTSIPGIIKVWWWNVVGAMAVGLVVAAIGGSMAESAYNTVAAHVAQGPWRSFLRAVGCGLVIDLSVWFYRSSKSLVPVLFGIPHRSPLVLPHHRHRQLRRLQRPPLAPARNQSFRIISLEANSLKHSIL